MNGQPLNLVGWTLPSAGIFRMRVNVALSQPMTTSLINTIFYL
jgi:hypothetical protein